MCFCFEKSTFFNVLLLIRPLSGTSCFSNDSLGAQTYFVYNGVVFVSICLIFFGGIKIDNRVFPILEFLCITLKPKNPTLIFTVIVFTISCKTYNLVANVNKCTAGAR